MNNLFSALWNCCFRTAGRLPFPAAARKPTSTPVHPAPAARRCALLALFLGLPLAAPGQAMPQDNWYPDLTFGRTGTQVDEFAVGSGNLSYLGMAIGSGGNVHFLNYTGRMQVFSPDGVFIRAVYGLMPTPHFIVLPDGDVVLRTEPHAQNTHAIRRHSMTTGSEIWAISLPKGDSVYDMAVSPDGKIYCLKQNSVKVITQAGGQVASWGVDPENLDSDFSGSSTLDIDRLGNLYIRNWRTLRVFTASGVYLRKFDLSATTANANDDSYKGFCMASDGYFYSLGGDSGNRDLCSFNSLGLLVAKTPIRFVDTTEVTNGGVGAHVDSRSRPYVQVNSVTRMAVTRYQRGYRTLPGTPGSTPPLTLVDSVSQRYGTSLFDVDYSVFDPDSPTVTTAAVAFRDGAQSLDKLVKMNTFVEGTGANMGEGIATNTPYRLTWDAAADFSTNFVNLAVAVMAKDERDLLGLHFLTIPASGGDPELTINRSPVTQAELMPLWYWLVARDNQNAFSLSNGNLYAQTWTPPAGVTNGFYGIFATYYDNSDFTGAAVSRSETQINYSGGAWQPATIASTTFSVRWEANITAETTETVTFYTATDDGVRLYVDDTLIINKWSSQAGSESSATFDFVAGQIYKIKMEYYQNTSSYSAVLRWSSPSMAKQVLPANRLWTPRPNRLLASGNTTYFQGKYYLMHELLGVREATYSEILRAKEAGHPGTINRYEPRVKVGAHPEKVNEYGFDTGTSWPTDSYFVVPLAP